MSLIDSLISWARKAANWLYNFLKHVWGRIVSWWSRLKEWLKACIQKYKEIVLLDSREDGGRELIEAIQEAQPTTTTIDDIDNLGEEGPVAVQVNYDGTIARIEDFEADVQQLDNYDKMQSQNNGILRING